LAQTEVLLGDFANKSAAEALASKAKGKKFRTTVYKSGSKWLVSARKFTDLEEAAQRLDQVEDSGFVGRLSASKAVSKKIALRTVRIGKMTSRQDAVAMLARINRSGFSGSYVVRRK
jgi:cell division septation protein DedD